MLEACRALGDSNAVSQVLRAMEHIGATTKDFESYSLARRTSLHKLILKAKHCRDKLRMQSLPALRYANQRYMLDEEQAQATNLTFISSIGPCNHHVKFER